MGWRDLVQTGPERVTVPWLGGRSLRTHDRLWSIEGRLPHDHGWYSFLVEGRKARLESKRDPAPETLRGIVRGYLVGDRLVPDGSRFEPNLATLQHSSEPVALLEPGLDRFVRISAGRWFESSPLVFGHQDFPLGPEDAVLQAYLDVAPNVDLVPGVVPALDMAFRLETWHRAETERARREEELRRVEEEARVAREERRQALARQHGSADGRRALATLDFAAAARAALAEGGAEYLDHRDAPVRGERIVRFRVEGRRFECVCNERLSIIDAGICLTDSDTGERGDERFTLESIPAVIREAQQLGVLVVLRNV